MKNINYPCPCCGFLTMSSLERDTFDICPVCYWEDDYIQFNDMDYAGGANEISLNEARQNFKKHGTSSLKFQNNVRQPLQDEIP